MQDSIQPLWGLEEFLVRSFTGDEMRRLIAQRYPQLQYELPAAPQGSSAQFVHATVNTLTRHGLLGDDFFVHLLLARPYRRSQILDIAVHFHADIDRIKTQTSDGEATQVFRSPFIVEPSLVDSLVQLLLEREHHRDNIQQRTALSADIERAARSIRARIPPRPGLRVAGTILECQIGVGNCGTVWRARREDTGQPAATKLFDLNRLTDGIMLWRFRRSIRAIDALDKPAAPPSIPRVYQISPDHLSFSMDLYNQGTLDHISRRGWSLETKIRVFCELARAVQFAHRTGVIHRDIKPSNILLDDQLRPVLVDYDIADISFLTQHGLTHGGLGTIMFAAPEQLYDSEEADERADIYSLGRVLHYMLIERAPGYPREDDPSLESLSTFPAPLVAAIRRATQGDPRRRHGCVRELIQEVESYRTGWSAFRASTLRFGRWAKRNSAMIGVSASISLGAWAHAIEKEKLADSYESILRVKMESLEDSRRHASELDAFLHQFMTLTYNLQRANIAHAWLADQVAKAESDLMKIEQKIRSMADRGDRRTLMTLKHLRISVGSRIPLLKRDLSLAKRELELTQDVFVSTARQIHHATQWESTGRLSVLDMSPGQAPHRRPSRASAPSESRVPAAELPPPPPPPPPIPSAPPAPSPTELTSSIAAEAPSSRSPEEQLQSLLESRMKQYLACARREHLSARAAVQLELSIARSGSPTRITVRSPQLGIHTRSCIRGKVSELGFPTSSEGVDSVYLFTIPANPSGATMIPLKIGSGRGLPPARVWIDGVPQQGKTPMSLEVAPRPHRILWKYPDGKTVSQRVNVTDAPTLIRGEIATGS